MIEKEKQIYSLYYIKNRNNKFKNNGFNYEKNLFKVIFSSLVFDNQKTQKFLSFLQKQVILMFESVLIVRNFYNYTINKYSKHHNN